MKIIIEYVLIENMLINLMSLKSTAVLTKEKGRFFLLSSFLGGCITVVLPLFRLSAIGSFLIEVGLACIYVCISFKFKTFKKFMLLFLTFFIVTFLYGGACFFIERYFGLRSTIIVLSLVFVVFAIIKSLSRYIQRRQNVENFCFEAEIENFGTKTKWKAFLDTGNLLFDPLTQSPVILINFKVFSALFKEIEIMDVLTHSKKVKLLKLAHYINLNTLNNSDKVLVFQVDRLCVGGKILDKPILGLSLKDFNQAFGSDIILHNSCIA